MSNWFHEVRGKYDIADRWIGIDYGKSFLDPQVANLALAHESCHGVIAMTEFGQATYVVYRLMDEFKHLSPDEKKEMSQLLYGSQIFVQEGLATFLQVSQLRKATDSKNALLWAQNELPSDYFERLQKLLFAFTWSQGYRDFFTSKLCDLSMETGIRKVAPKLDLFGSVEKLKTYLSQEDNNPDIRMEKVISILKYKPWLVTKSLPEIAQASGITYHDFSSKEDVANFLNYFARFTDSKRVFTPADIGDTPKGAEAFKSVAQNMVVANMNVQFAGNSMALFTLDDFLHYADKMNIIFVNPNDETKHRELIKAISGHEPEINIAGICRTGEKYITSTSKDKASEILNNALFHVSMMVKWGGYNIIKDKLIWSDEVRSPDLVVYNTTNQMLGAIKKLLEENSAIKLSYIHIGATEGHPLQTLIIKIKGRTSLHLVNTFGNKGIIEILNTIKGKSKKITDEEFRSDKKHLNNLFSFWMGLHWEIDWVETMLDKKKLIFRK